ncbi:MAG: type VI secretion system-associated protein TagF [Pseudomonadales bacterium]|jgi:type VI secretion system protein ImpM|tara:strand:+ start:16221 stop:16862 length:642 start_codon:yes stop_codon:yes gene_type:complete
MENGFGAFGKIPTLADFLRVNLPPSFISPWDSWLQVGILEMKKNLSAREWNNKYLTAPIWRFTLPPGVAGKKAVSGVLMPSVDKVGRQYPLTLVCQHGTIKTAQMHFSNTLMFEQLEEIALSALDYCSLEMLISSLAKVRISEVLLGSNTSLPYYIKSSTGPVVSNGLIFKNQLDGETLWSTKVEGKHSFMLSQGLPKESDLNVLFDISLLDF